MMRPVLFLLTSLMVVSPMMGQTTPGVPGLPEAVTSLTKELVARYGETQRPRIERGLRQAADLWRGEDGDTASFADVMRTHFVGTNAGLDTMFNRLEFLFEQLNGHMGEIGREFRAQSDLDEGPIMPFDEILAGYDPSAHVIDDFFNNKIAFAILVNFPLTSLQERLANGDAWTRREWAAARLTRPFAARIPASVDLEIARAASEAAQYIAGYNIWMHHCVDSRGARLFPAGLRLLSHWNLRDQIKAEYAEGKDGLAKQRMIWKVMERIVTQTIPAVVVDNPGVDWDPFANTVAVAGVRDDAGDRPPLSHVVPDPEPDTRYRVLLSTFRAARTADPFCPNAPTMIARRFNDDREIPEERVRAMLEQILSSPLVPRVAKLIEQRLGRQLEPFDVWYNGFLPRNAHNEAELDSIVRRKYPTAEAYKQDIPRMLMVLGFSRERAEFYAAHIDVDPARGSGHAMGASMRSAHAHLRTRVEASGMNYKGFNIAVHEMGHNVEQVTSLNLIDHTLLGGVPNTAFTEALAFVFQGHDLELLGLSTPDSRQEAWKDLNDFWSAYEIAGVALVDMAVWHWMYDNPGATPAELKEAVLRIARETWNKFYAPVFGVRDVVLLGVYSHMIDSFMYLPDYPIGHIIAHQIEEQMKKAGSVGREFERMAKTGCVAPDLWMKKATGSPVSADALLTGAQRALGEIEGEGAGARQ